MCGIYGHVSTKRLAPPEPDGSALRHRGPDGHGVWPTPDGHGWLGHDRLAIVDLSPSGGQPMLHGDEPLAIVFNGEIYGHAQIREELVRAGVVFRGTSDTETVLEAFSRWGPASVHRLDGMFAFAIWDGRDDARPGLFAARDRLGKKPFYYGLDGGGLRFASELRALRPLTAGPDPDAINAYLRLGYVPGEASIAAGVRRLQPGHILQYDIYARTLRTERYWSVPAQDPAAPADLEAHLDTIEPLFVDAVRRRLQADVPVGILLSGGLDSSLVVAAARRVTDGPLLTFSVAFPGSHLDETAHAARIAEHYGTDHHVLRAPERDDEVLKALLDHVDEPLGDSSLIPTWLVSRLASKHVKVVLGGDGGDELFAGYSHLRTALRDERLLVPLVRPLVAAAAHAARALPPGVRGRNRVVSLARGGLAQGIEGTSFFDATARRHLLASAVLERLAQPFEAPEAHLRRLHDAGTTPAERLLLPHLLSVLPDDYLVKTDRAGMAHGLEIRAPWLDHRLVEYVYRSVPTSLKISVSETRIIQKALGRRMLPAWFDFDRKQGFSIPLDDWLRGRDPEWIVTHLGPLRDILNPKAVADLLAGHAKGRANGARIFALLQLAAALRNNGWCA